MNNDSSSWTLHAPNIHTGGGLALLTSLLASLPPEISVLQCDQRAKEALNLPADTKVTYVAPNLWSRLRAEWRLRTYSVLCLHSLPPLFGSAGKAVVFVHSRLLVSADTLEEYPLRTRLRLMAERYWLRALRHRADLFVVQTPSMAEALKRIAGNVLVEVCLFAPAIVKEALATPRYDYVYPATGDAHKNHATLLAAWRLLAQKGITPTLALTVDATHYAALAQGIAKAGLNITNLGALQASEMADLYGSSRALIFPSTTESLGLPLLEAAQYGLPILAAEKDYVRDIVVPVETFDPASALSIARAVMRHQDRAMPCAMVGNAESLWAKLKR